MTLKESIMIVAGEASADAHAAALVHELEKLRPGLSVYGVGGKALEACGAELFLDFSRVGVVGVSEVLPELSRFFSAYRALVKSLARRQPAGAILLDLPDFNIILARKIKKISPQTKVIYYISPQVWGWRPGRVKKIAKRADAMLTLFPFEADIYREAGMDAEFVGHPLRERVKPSNAPHLLREEFKIEGSGPVVGLLPGSRKAEVNRHLPVIVEFAAMLAKERPQARFLLAKAPTLDNSIIQERLAVNAGLVKVVEHRTHDVLAASDLAVVASGTATLEAAILGVPMVVLGAVSWPTYLLVKPFVLIENYSLPNVIAKKKIVPELEQWEVNAKKLLATVLDLLDHPEKAALMKQELAKVREALGPEGASKRTALAVQRRIWGDMRGEV